MKKIKSLIFNVLAAIGLTVLGAWTPSVALSAAEYRYANAQLYSLYATETVTFDTKESDAKANYAPQFTAISGLTNACGAVAGSEIVSYYDKYYPDMIPGWESFYAASGKYRAQDKVYIPSVMNELYTLMRTNVDGDGVSESDFTDGLAQYITDKGYSMNMQSVMSGTTVDYAACKNAIDNNKVIVLFTRATDMYLLSEGTTQDSISTITISASHIMVVSGYRESKYYKSGKLFRTDRYLVASTGLGSPKAAYYKPDNNKLNGAYIVNIL
ncbi:MAG: hypothetical protein J1G01_01375 [Clostridiales bacterium]|nr:hypothetical protein [Clostridiales bacterium]